MILDAKQKETFDGLLRAYINEPNDAQYNFALGLFYYTIGQTAAAVGLFIRTAERTEDKELMYECMMLCADCFAQQGTRGISVKGMLKHAVSINPRRPEAYLKLAMDQEMTDTASNWFDSYLTSSLALEFCDFDLPPLQYSTSYPGKYALVFQKGHTAWWCGMTDESRDIMLDLHDNYQDVMTVHYQNLVHQNLIATGVFGPPVDATPQLEVLTPNFAVYNTTKHANLRHKFKMSKSIEQNYSESYQDMFVLSVVDGKREGTYLEIGSCRPFYGNNTALLEKDYAWKGVSIDYEEQFVSMFKQERKNPCYCKDATTVNYSALLAAHDMPEVIDYLQVDCEPPGVTFEALLNIPFDKHRFRVITYEHDYYADETKSFKDKSRKYLESLGYVLVVDDISPDDNRPYEDWWVHPELVDADILQKMKQVDGQTKMSEKYMLSGQPEISTVRSNFDWGLIKENEWFHGIVSGEVFERQIYSKFFDVEPGDTVMDIGASVGPFLETIRDKKASKIIAIEPHKELYKTLMHNTLGMPVTNVNKAIGASNGEETIYTLFDPDVINTGESTAGTTVNTIEFNSLRKQYRVDHIDFLKMDCEGAEYYIFNDENMQWIKDNVRKIVGEWHLATPEQQQQFRHFRDTYLKQFDNFEVYSFDEVNIKHDLWSDWFLDHYNEITIYIDNRVPSKPPVEVIARQSNVIHVPKSTVPQPWKNSIAPTMEFTTCVPKKGCVVDCVFCPQQTLLSVYKGEKTLSLDNFKRIVDKIPEEVRITFAGFTEPWLNKQCTDMLLYAHETGHPVSAFTTVVGMTIEDIERIKHVPFAGRPNGGFTVHLPDQERKAKHPIADKFIETVEHMQKVHKEIQNFSVMCMGEVHESVRHLWPDAPVYDMWSRAGNLIGEAALKPEVNKYIFKSIDHGDQPMTCGCDERLYHNVCMPNGDVALCCMDYKLEHITGNILESTYDEVVPAPYSCYEMCNKCENAVSINDPFIKTEMASIGL